MNAVIITSTRKVDSRVREHHCVNGTGIGVTPSCLTDHTALTIGHAPSCPARSNGA